MNQPQADRLVACPFCRSAVHVSHDVGVGTLVWCVRCEEVYVVEADGTRSANAAELAEITQSRVVQLNADLAAWLRSKAGAVVGHA